MKRYLIKATYLDGTSKGSSYLVKKGGYVTEADDARDTASTYASYGTAMRRCRQLKEENDLEVMVEDRRRKRAQEQGEKVLPFRVFDHAAFEPYEIEVADTENK